MTICRSPNARHASLSFGRGTLRFSTAICWRSATSRPGSPRARDWAPEDFRCDLYYWAAGTEALAQLGGSTWKIWRAALWRALLGSQRADEPGSCAGGSWDPLGPWGCAGGRVHSTALALLCLEGEFRYPRLTR